MKGIMSWIVMIVIAVSIFGLMTDKLTAIWDVVILTPWWVYVMIAGVMFSGYQYARHMRKEQQIEQEWIEKDGNVFIRRMKEEKENRIKEAMEKDEEN